jgi:hypothetical protein
VPVSSPAELPESATPRLHLAALVRAAALATPGVVGLDAGRSGVRMTAGDGLRVDGVVCAALPSGRYQASVYVVVTMVPLRQLADAIRARVQRDAAVAGLTVHLGPVDVTVEDIVEPTEALP